MVWADLACSLICDENLRPMYFVAQVEDVTARHEAEQELRLHEEITRNMAEGVVLVRNRDWQIVYANRKFEEMFGYEPRRADSGCRSTSSTPTSTTPMAQEEIPLFRAFRGEHVKDAEMVSRPRTASRAACWPAAGRSSPRTASGSGPW